MNQIVIVVLIVGMIGLMFWNTRKQKQQREEVQKMRDSFTPGMLVRTGSGFLGTIEQVDTDSVVIRSEDGSLSRWMTEAVSLRTNPAQPDSSRFGKSPAQIAPNDDSADDTGDDSGDTSGDSGDASGDLGDGSETSVTDSESDSAAAAETSAESDMKTGTESAPDTGLETDLAVDKPVKTAQVRKSSKTTAKAASKSSAKPRTKKSSSTTKNLS